MSPTLRPSTVEKTKTSKRLSFKRDIERKVKQGKLRVSRIPGPIRTGVLGWPGPRPIRVPPVEQIYLDTQSNAADIAALIRQHKTYKHELYEFQKRVKYLEEDNEYLRNAVSRLTGRSPVYYPTSPFYSPIPDEFPDEN